MPVPRADGAESVHLTPDLRLSEEAFPAGGAVAAPEEQAEETAETEDEAHEDEAAVEATEVDADEPQAEAAAEAQAVTDDAAARRGGARRRGRRRGAGGRARGRRDLVASLGAPAAPARPVAVAITGGIGAGKSTALDAFRAHGAATVSSDEIVHHLLAADDGVRDAIVERLGPDALGEDGRPTGRASLRRSSATRS